MPLGRESLSPHERVQNRTREQTVASLISRIQEGIAELMQRQAPAAEDAQEADQSPQAQVPANTNEKEHRSQAETDHVVQETERCPNENDTTAAA